MSLVQDFTHLPTPTLRRVADTVLQILAERDGGSVVERMRRMRVGETILILSRAKRFDGHYQGEAATRLCQPRAKWKTRHVTLGFRITRVR